MPIGITAGAPVAAPAPSFPSLLRPVPYLSAVHYLPFSPSPKAMFTVTLLPCAAGATLPLATSRPLGCDAHLVVAPGHGEAASGSRGSHCPPSALPFLPVGTCLVPVAHDGSGKPSGASAGSSKDGSPADDTGTSPLLRVEGHVLLPAKNGPHALSCPLVTACTDLPVGETELAPVRKGISVAWVTLSDRGHAGLREDKSGPALAGAVAAHLDVNFMRGHLLPDSGERLRALLVHLALTEGYDLVLTTGGTGVAPTDVSPEATAKVLDFRLPGFEHAMMRASLEKTPMGCISRAVAGVLGRTIIVNLPGSTRAVLENLEPLLPALGHALDKLRGDPSDCADIRGRS